MNRLWVRLAITFSAVVVIAAGILIAFSLLLTERGALRLLIEYDLQRSGGFIDQLTDYYEAHGSWDGIANNVTHVLSDGSINVSARLRTAAGEEYELVPDPFNQGTTQEIFPLDLPTGPSASLILEYPTFATNLNTMSRALLLIAVVGGVVGLVFAFFVSRSLTAPLIRLSEAAKAIGARNLKARVREGGTYELVELARAFNTMADDLERGESLRQAMLADVAHELRTPLSVLIGNLRAMLDDVYPTDKTEVARLYDQARLLIRLVSDLHELAQAEARQLPLVLQTTSVATLIDQTRQLFEPMAEQLEVTLSTQIAPELPPIYVDRTRIAQVLHNLFANALQHTPSGGSIRVVAQFVNDMVEIQIEDTGEGIASEHLIHVFDRFYRTDSARTRNTGGSGLGLAITKAIVELHNGTILVTSTVGQGTMFTLRLPVIDTKASIQPV